MSPPKKERIPSYLQDVLKSAHFATEYLASFTDLSTLDDQDNQEVATNIMRDGIVRRLEVIGQALDNIQKADPDFAAASGLDIAGWYGLRSKISHGYDIVVYATLVAVIEQNVPPLVKQVQELLESVKPSL